MTEGALIMMIAIQVAVTSITVYFFIKVIRRSKKTIDDVPQERQE